MTQELPNEIIIELTDECNYNCDFCMKREYSHKKTHDISFNELKKILLDMKNSNIKTVRFTGGEPFLYAEFEEVLKFAKSLNLKVIVNTNGSLIDSCNINLFKNIDIVLFSWHNLEDSYNLFEIIKKIMEYKTEIMICTILIEKNIFNIKEFYKFFIKNFLRLGGKIEWFFLRNVETKCLSKDKINLKIAINSIYFLNKRLKLDIKIANSLPFCFLGERESFKISKICSGGYSDCGRTRLFIDSDGNYKLDYFTSIIANIYDAKILSVWNNRPKVSLLRKCNTCIYLNKCQGALGNNDVLLKQDFKKSKLDASIIILYYNDLKRLDLLLNSLLNQTNQNFEVILVDDGSTILPKKVIEKDKFKDLKIRYIYLNNKEIFGASISRNKAASVANSENLIFLDQDIILDKETVNNYIKEIKFNDVVLGYISGYGTNEKYTMKELEKIAYFKKRPDKIIYDFRDSFFSIKETHDDSIWQYFCSGNFCIKKQIFDKFKFDEEFKKWGAEDLDLGYILVKNKINIKFSKKCLGFNTSLRYFMDKEKTVSLVESLFYMFNKYNDFNILQYLVVRYYFVPLEVRANLKLMVNKNTVEIVKKKYYCFFRIDDVYKLSLKVDKIIDIFEKNKIPFNLQVVPKLLEKDFKEYILKKISKKSISCSINQHGYSHRNYSDSNVEYNKYEFGEKRNYDEQFLDISKGQEILKLNFKKNFRKIFTPPFYGYNFETLRVLKNQNYNMISLRDNKEHNNCFIFSLNDNLDIVKDYKSRACYDFSENIMRIDVKLKNDSYLGFVLHPELMTSNDFQNFEKILKYLKEKKCNFLKMEKFYDIKSKETEINMYKNNKMKIKVSLDIEDYFDSLKILFRQVNEVELDFLYFFNFSNKEKKEIRHKLKRLIKLIKENKCNLDLKRARMQSIQLEEIFLAPEVVSIDFYNKCNLKCKFCVIHSELLKDNKTTFGSLSYEEIIKIIDEAKDLGTETITISSAGEPLLCDYSFKIIEYILENKLKLYLMTNGILLENKYFNIFSKYDNIELLINCSYSKQETAKELCNVSSNDFKKLKKNIEKLSELKKLSIKNNKNFDFNFVYVITNKNFMEIENYLDMLKNTLVKSVFFKFAILYEKTESLLLSREEMTEFKKIISRAKIKAFNNGIKTNLEEIGTSTLNEGFKFKNDIKKYNSKIIKKCYNPWFFGRVNSDGKYYICCRETIEIGNVHEGSLIEIIYSKRMSRLLRESLKGINFQKKQWKKCNYCYHIDNNERALNFILTGKIKSNYSN